MQIDERGACSVTVTFLKKGKSNGLRTFLGTEQYIQFRTAFQADRRTFLFTKPFDEGYHIEYEIIFRRVVPDRILYFR